MINASVLFINQHFPYTNTPRHTVLEILLFQVATDQLINWGHLHDVASDFCCFTAGVIQGLTNPQWTLGL